MVRRGHRTVKGVSCVGYLRDGDAGGDLRGAVRGDGRGRARLDPRGARGEVRERRGDGAGLADRGAARRPARDAARALRGHRPAPSFPARLQRRDAGPDHDLLAVRSARSRATSWISPGRCASRCCTRSATTSACPTRGCTSWAGREPGVVPGLSDNGRWRNWGHNQQSTPAAVDEPRSLLEVVESVETAASAGQTVKVVASGHSFSDVAVHDGPHAAARRAGPRRRDRPGRDDRDRRSRHPALAAQRRAGPARSRALQPGRHRPPDDRRCDLDRYARHRPAVRVDRGVDRRPGAGDRERRGPALLRD